MKHLLLLVRTFALLIEVGTVLRSLGERNFRGGTRVGNLGEFGSPLGGILRTWVTLDSLLRTLALTL